MEGYELFHRLQKRIWTIPHFWPLIFLEYCILVWYCRIRSLMMTSLLVLCVLPLWNCLSADTESHRYHVALLTNNKTKPEFTIQAWNFLTHMVSYSSELSNPDLPDLLPCLFFISHSTARCCLTSFHLLME